MEDRSVSYETFVRLVSTHGWTLAELRCDIRPSPELLDAMGLVGLDAWERFVRCLERDAWL